MSGRSSNGATKNKNAAVETTGSGKRSVYSPDSNGSGIGWSSVEADYIFDAIDAITTNGDAVLFARSMDGGVLVLTVCEGSERIKFYARTGEEMGTHLQKIRDALNYRSGR